MIDTLQQYVLYKTFGINGRTYPIDNKQCALALLIPKGNNDQYDVIVLMPDDTVNIFKNVSNDDLSDYEEEITQDGIEEVDAFFHNAQNINTTKNSAIFSVTSSLYNTVDLLVIINGILHSIILKDLDKQSRNLITGKIIEIKNASFMLDNDDNHTLYFKCYSQQNHYYKLKKQATDTFLTVQKITEDDYVLHKNQQYEAVSPNNLTNVLPNILCNDLYKVIPEQNIKVIPGQNIEVIPGQNIEVITPTTSDCNFKRIIKCTALSLLAVSAVIGSCLWLSHARKITNLGQNIGAVISLCLSLCLVGAVFLYNCHELDTKCDEVNINTAVKLPAAPNI